MKELRNEETEMSKFLKLIVDLVIICTILIAAALLVPPLAGVKTVMNDNSTAETNLPVGSVAYGKQTDAVNLKKGQKIVFIHGKGDGVLRKAILQELKYKYKNYQSQDASFREYGFGATMVTIKADTSQHGH